MPHLEEMVVDGIIAIETIDVRAYHSAKHLIPQQIKVKEIMTASPKTVAPTTPLTSVIHFMLDNRLKGIPVVDAEQHPVGIITSNDLMTKAGLPIRLGLLPKLDEANLNAFMKSIAGKTAKDVMSTPLVTVKQDLLLKNAVQTMVNHHLKRLPVVDDAGKLVGIIARIDIFHTITKQVPTWHSLQEQNIVVNNTQPVKAVAVRDSETVHPDTPISEVFAKISGKEIQRIAVTDEEGKLIGLICDFDLLPLILGQPGFWDSLRSKLALTEQGRQWNEFVKHAQARTASEVMIKNPITITEEATIDEAVKLMTEQGLKRLPVIDSQGIFKGMISRDMVLQTALK
jgi:CBS domain-containing protein